MKKIWIAKWKGSSSVRFLSNSRMHPNPSGFKPAILYSIILILLLMGLIIALVENARSEMIREEAKKRGMAVARTLAAVCPNALLTYNYVILQQNGERVP